MNWFKMGFGMTMGHLSCKTRLGNHLHRRDPDTCGDPVTNIVKAIANARAGPIAWSAKRRHTTIEMQRLPPRSATSMRLHGQQDWCNQRR